MLSAFGGTAWEDICSSSNLNNSFLCWKAQFFKAVERFIPRTTILKKSSQQGKPWFTNYLRHLIAKKNKLYKQSFRSMHPGDWQRYCTAENKATNAGKAAKHAYYQRKASLLANTNCQTTWWKTAREICGFRRLPNFSTVKPFGRLRHSVTTTNTLFHLG